MSYRIQCQCGALQGQLAQPQRAVRGVCYCKDCRAYVSHLDKGAQALDSLGGMEFVATQAKYLSFTAGLENLACLSLSDQGALRWYATCCNTPIGNTARDWKLPCLGLVHTCLKADEAAFERAFPRLQMRVSTESAFAPPPGMRLRTLVTLMGFIPSVMMGRLNGSYKSTPFFNSATGAAVLDVKVLSSAERERAYSVPGG
jgi:hypothetical protein